MNKLLIYFKKFCMGFVNFCTNIMKNIQNDIKKKQEVAQEMKDTYNQAYREERKRQLIEQARRKARGIEKRHQTRLAFDPPNLSIPSTFWEKEKGENNGNG